MDVMIDLETIGQQSDAGMATIAAIEFDRDKDVLSLTDGRYPESVDELHSIFNCFYVRVKLKSLAQAGFNWSKETTEWWLAQDPEVRFEALDAKPRTMVNQALYDFYHWYPMGGVAWSHGASFDLVIMRNGLERFEMTTPWKFWDERCTRTLYDLAGLDGQTQKQMRGNNHHHALFDCYDQIVMLQESFRRLRV